MTTPFPRFSLGGTTLDRTYQDAIITTDSLFLLSHCSPESLDPLGIPSVARIEGNKVKFTSTNRLDYSTISILTYTPLTDKWSSNNVVNIINPIKVQLQGGKAHVSPHTPATLPSVFSYTKFNGTPGVLRITGDFENFDIISTSDEDCSEVGIFLLTDTFQPEPPPNMFVGQAQLVNGQAIVKCPDVQAESIILTSHHTAGGVIGPLNICSIEPGIGFCIESYSRLDTSSVDWFFHKD